MLSTPLRVENASSTLPKVIKGGEIILASPKLPEGAVANSCLWPVGRGRSSDGVTSILSLELNVVVGVSTRLGVL